MPSIPQSLLWISLVVLWLFVLVPMLISRRDAVRRTSDVALATRVLNSGRAARAVDLLAQLGEVGVGVADQQPGSQEAIERRRGPAVAEEEPARHGEPQRRHLRGCGTLDVEVAHPRRRCGVRRALTGVAQGPTGVVATGTGAVLRVGPAASNSELAIRPQAGVPE